MEISAHEINVKQFHDQWRGYSQEEVDDFLDRVAETVDRLTRENRTLHQRIKELDQTVASGRETEDMLKKTLVTAQKAAEEAIGAAKAKADQLIAEAEQRVVRATDEARVKMTALEGELRRKTLDADREHAAHKRDLDSQLERLRAFETELKQRLKTFLEQQLRALDTLISDARVQARPAQAQGAPRTQAQPAQRLHATPSPQRPEDPEAAPTAAQPAQSAREEEVPVGTDPGEEDDAATASPRRGLRGLFWGDER